MRKRPDTPSGQRPLIKGQVLRRGRASLPRPNPRAISLPHTLISRVPVIGRIVKGRALMKAKTQAPASFIGRNKISRFPGQIIRMLGQKKEPEPALRLAMIPFVSPVVRRMRHPIERTVRVVQVAREVRQPRTRWERLREAAELALRDPAMAVRWERLMGLGLALVAGAPAERQVPPSRLRRILHTEKAEPAETRGLRARLIGKLIPESIRKNADPKPTGRRRLKRR